MTRSYKKKRNLKLLSAMPDIVVGDTLYFKLLCKFITSDGWVTPAEVVTSFQRLPRSAFSNNLKWFEDTNFMRVILPDQHRHRTDKKQLVTKVEVTGRFKVQDGSSGKSQLIDYIRSWSADDLSSNMKLSLSARPPQRIEENTGDFVDVVDDVEDVENVELAIPDPPRTGDRAPKARPRRKRLTQPESPILKPLGRHATFPELPVDVDDRTEVKPSVVPGAGNGLFAKYNFKKGTTVAEIKSPVLISRADALKAVEEGFPDDAFFHLDKMKGLLKSQRNKSFLADKSFRDPEYPPKWYYLNHGASSANSVFGYDEATKKATWVAKVNIPEGSELFFNYNPGERTTFQS